MLEWKDLTLERLREVARFYNKQVKIMGVSKMKKADLTTELKKHLDFNGTAFTHKKQKDIKLLLNKLEATAPQKQTKPSKKAVDDFYQNLLEKARKKKEKESYV